MFDRCSIRGKNIGNRATMVANSFNGEGGRTPFGERASFSGPGTVLKARKNFLKHIMKGLHTENCINPMRRQEYPTPIPHSLLPIIDGSFVRANTIDRFRKEVLFYAPMTCR